MVIDSSVLIAILEVEAEAEQLAEAIEQDQVRLISAASVVETTIVIESRRGKEGGKALNLLMEKMAIEIITCYCGACCYCLSSASKFWKGAASCKTQFWRLFFLCDG